MSDNFRPIKERDVRYRNPFFLICAECGEEVTGATQDGLVWLANAAYGWRCDENESPPRILCNWCVERAKEERE